MTRIDLSIIIPAFREEENLRVIIPRISQTIVEMGISAEILVVDTMIAMDNTRQVCIENQVNYVSRVGGDSYGDAVRTGINEAKGMHILFMDADGSHSPEFIAKLFAVKNKGNIIIASRYVKYGGSDNSRVLIMMSWLVNAIYSLVLGINCRDVSNSFKLYEQNIIKPLILKCNNFDIVEEILVRAKRSTPSLKVIEIPYLFKERMFGHTKRNLWLFMFSYVITLIRLRFSK